MKLFTKFWVSIITVTIIVLSAALSIQTYMIQRAQNETSSATLFEQAMATEALIENNIPILDIYTNLKRFSLSKKASALLINANFPQERTGFFYDDEYEREMMSYEDYFTPFIESKERINRYIPSEFDKLSYTILYGRPMPDGTYLLLSCRTVTLQGVVFNSLAQLWTILLLSLFLSIAIAYFLAKNISNPLREITKASQQIASGNFEVDISVKGNDELANVAESINSMSKELQKASKFKDEIISNVSHSLKTPIAAILTYCELLQTCETTKEKQTEFINIIEERASKLETMVKSLIMLSKIETGTEPITFADFDLCDLSENCIESFGILSEKKGVKVSLTCEESEIFVRTDYEKLLNILSNLISNALNHTPRDGAVSVVILPKNNCVDVVVKDSGEGISDADLPHIWDRFYKSDNSTLNKENGTGLGLDIVKKLFDLLKYKYSIVSEIGVGTEIMFSIPKQEDLWTL